MCEGIKVVLWGLAGAVWFLPHAAVADEGPALLGTVKIDGFKFEVFLHDVADDREQFLVAIRGVKAKDAPPVRTDRVKVWLLRSNFQSGGPAMALEDYPEQPNLPERDVATGREVQANFQFASRGLRREHMYAVVVAIDDEPRVFKLVRPGK